jgi:hypothetical protein
LAVSGDFGRHGHVGQRIKIGGRKALVALDARIKLWIKTSDVLQEVPFLSGC